MKKTIQTSNFCRKSYAKPRMEASQLKSSSIICSSETTPTTQNEEYEEVSTTVTDSWFN